MALKGKQRNNDFNNDLMDSDSVVNDSAAHSASNDKNGKEITPTPFLSQLFDSLKSPTDNPSSESLTPLSNDETPRDVSDKSPIASPEGSSQTPFLSQLFDRVSSSKILPDNNDEHTETQTETNSIGQPDSNMNKDSDNKITETLTNRLFQSKSTNDVDEEIQIKETENLNSNRINLKKNVQKLHEDEVESENNISQTPFLSQLFNVLDKPSISSGEINKKPIHSSLDKTTNDVYEKIETKVEKYKENLPENEVESENNVSQTPFLSQLFNSLDKSSILSEEIIKKPTHSTLGESLSSQNSNKSLDDTKVLPDKKEHLNSNRIDLEKNLQKLPREEYESENNISQAPFLSQLFNSLDKSSTSSGEINKKLIHSTLDKTTDSEKIETKVNKYKENFPENEVESENNVSQTPFLSQLFNSLDKSSTLPSEISKKHTHSTIDETKNHISEKVDIKGTVHSSLNRTDFKKNVKELTNNEVESENNTSQTPFLSQLFNVLDKSSTSSGEVNKKPTHSTLGDSFSSRNSSKTTDDNDNPPTKTSLPTALTQLSDAPSVSNPPGEHSSKDKDHSPKKTMSNIQDERASSNTTSAAPFLSQLFSSLSSSGISNTSKKEYDNLNYSKISEKTNSENIAQEENKCAKKSSHSSKVEHDSNSNNLSDNLNSKSISEVKTALTDKSTTVPFLTQLFGTLENKKMTYDQLSDDELNDEIINDSNNTNIVSKMPSNPQYQNESSKGGAEHIEETETKPFLSQLFSSISNKSAQETPVDGEGQERDNSLSKERASKKKDQNCFKFDKKFYLHQLEIADAVKDGNLKEINENLTTGLVLAAKATGHLVGEIYEWVKMSYPNNLELKLSDIAKQLLLMTKIIEYFDETLFSKNEFEEWMTQLNHPYVFPSDNNKMLWSNVLKNDELCHKVDLFLRKQMEIEHMQDENEQSHDQSESSWNQSEGNYRRSRHQYGSQRDYKSNKYEGDHSRNQSDSSRNDFYHSRDQLDQPSDQFGSSSDSQSQVRDDYGNSMNEFDHPRDQWGSTRDGFGHSTSRDDFGPPRNECSLPQEERFTPPVATPNTFPTEYAHWQHPPPTQNPSEVVQTGPKPPPFIIAPSSVPYSNVPYHGGSAPNFAPNNPHHPAVMPFGEIAPPVPPPPIPQTLLQMHPPLNFTQITAADPNTSYSNVLLPEAWIKAQNLLKCKENLPSCPLPSLPKPAVSPPIISGQNVPDKDNSNKHIMTPENTSQYNPLIETTNHNDYVSAAQIAQSAPATTSSSLSNENMSASTQSIKKHKIDIKLKKKRKPDENEDSKKSVYICCLPKGLGNEMMKKLLLVCGEVEEFHREIIDGVEAESCVVKFQDVETVFKSYHLLNEFMILDSMLIVAVLNEKLFTDEDKEIDEREIADCQSTIDSIKNDIEMEVMKPNIEYSSSKRSLDDQESVNKKFKADNDEEIYGPDCTDIEISNLDLDIGKILMVPVLEKCGGVVKWRELDGKILFKYKNKLSAVIASQLLKELRIPDKYLKIAILSKEAETLEAMEVDKGKKNTMKSWLNQAIVANQEEFVNHLQKYCGMYRLNDFDPFAYKTKMCLEEKDKCSGNCDGYHIPEKKDRRRDPRIYNYSDIECKHFQDGKSCPDGDMCHKSHTENEREFHESRIHASICRKWEKLKKKCDAKKLCISAHPETPEVLFSEDWHDLFVSGLHQTYQYLEGSVHNLRNIKMEPGAMYVVVVSPSTFMVRWLTKAIRKLAGRHRLRVEEVTEEKTAVDGATIVIGTPDNVVKMLSGGSHRSYLGHVTCLILDDVSLLLHKHFKNMKNILNNIMRYSSKELNKIVVGESIFQSEVDTLSLLLETKFNVIGDIQSEGGFSAPQDIKDEKKKEVKKKRYLSPEDRSSRSRSPGSKSPLSRSPASRSPRSYRDHSPGSPRTRYRDQSPGSPRSRYRNHSPFSPRFRYRDYSPDHSPNSPRSRYREHSPGSPRSRYKRHSPGSPRGRYRGNSPGNRSPRSRYRDFSPEKGGPSRSNFSEYPIRNRSRFPPNASSNRGGPSRYNDHYSRGRGRGGPNHRFPRGRGRGGPGGPTHRIGPPMEIEPPMEFGPPPMEMRLPIEINFPIVDHCYNLRSICDDLGLAGYTLRTIIVKALNLGPKPHKILESLRDANVLVQMNKEAAEFKLLEKRADNVISEENFKHAYIQTKMLVDYLKSIVHMGAVDQYGLNIRRIAIETLNKKIEYVNEEIKVHLRSLRVTPTPKNVFEILAVVLGERSIINANRPKGSFHYDDTDMSSLNDAQSDEDDDLEMVNVKKAEPIGGI